MGSEALPRKLHPDLYEQANEPQDAAEWPERPLPIESTATCLRIGRLAVIDAGGGHIKIEIDNPAPREMEAELLPPAAARAFVDWIGGIGSRLN